MVDASYPLPTNKQLGDPGLLQDLMQAYACINDLNTRLTAAQAALRDTGWRNIAGLLINGWTVTAGAALKIRRVGPRVDLLAGAPLAGGASTKDHFLPSTGNMIPFSPTHGDPIGIAIPTIPTSPSRYLQCAPGNVFYLNGGAQIDYQLVATWHTDAAWPTSLPGTAV